LIFRSVEGDVKVIMAKDSAFILLRLRRNSPELRVRETTLKDGDFLLRPSQSYKLKINWTG
ncbi:hypothetical protein, partial [Methanothrix sp.]|uniref:hypothetical protein n=1 Tax=Methanothrix sp. TaxID=90426 RepID=UPI003BB75ACC